MVEISLRDYYGNVYLEFNKVRLQLGLSCSLTDTKCVDYDGSHAFWEMPPPDLCGLNKYSVLFDGSVKKGKRSSFIA